jgi:hypothetical protein
MDIIQSMRSLGLDCAYHKFNSPPPLPYTVVLYGTSEDLMADNHNYLDIGNYRLELYTAIKHPPSEKKIEDWLKASRIPYAKFEAFIESEKMFQVVYNIQLMEG